MREQADTLRTHRKRGVLAITGDNNVSGFHLRTHRKRGVLAITGTNNCTGFQPRRAQTRGVCNRSKDAGDGLRRIELFFLEKMKMDLLEGLRKSFKENQAAELAKGWQRYQEILRRLVDEKKVDPAEVATVLDAIGKSVDDIPADVDNVKRRAAIKQRAADAELARPKLAEAQAALDALKAEKQAFLDQIIPRIESAVAERDRLVAVVNGGSGIERELIQTCRDPGLRHQLDATDDEARTITARESELAYRNTRDRVGSYSAELAELQNAKNALHRRRREIEAAMISQ